MDTFRHYIKLCILSLILLSSPAIYAQTIEFNIQGASIEEQDTFVVALQTSTDLTGEGVYAYRFQVTYPTSYYEFLDVDSVGSMLDSWGLPTINSSTPGALRMSGAGANALEGTGDVIYLKFRAVRSGNNYIGFDSNQSYVNEGAPASSFTSGYITASAISYPNISPDSGQMFVGDAITLSASGGLAPYTYSSANNAVALIEDDNILRAVGPGYTKAYVTDDNGNINYTSGSFDVRGVRMKIPNDVTGWPTETILLPLEIEVASGTQIFSGTIEISFPSGVTPSENPVQQGDFATSVERRVIGSRLHLTFASSTPITGTGVLVYIPFEAINSGNHYIAFQNTLFNETLLSFNTNDYIRISTLPVLSISPTSGSISYGENINLTVSNGNPPYTYEVSDTDVASVDESGVVTGISGGTFNVTATDNFGASITTGTFTVYDHTLQINNTDGNLDVDTRVAISTSQLPTGRDIYSFEGNITFNTNQLELVSIEPLNSSMIIESIVEGGNIQLVGASTNPIDLNDVFYLNFRIKNTVPVLGTTSVNFGSFSLNEGQLFSILDNGVITRVEQDSYRPVADAGNNFSANENTNIQLDGSGSYDLDDDPITYLWTAPEGIVLDDATLVNPSFDAPEVNQNTILTFSLITNDGTSDSDPSMVDVTVLQVNKVPTAHAGEDASYPEGNSVSLDGSASSDPDDQELIFNWESLDGIVLFNTHSETPSFIAPSVEDNTSYRFKLTVNDGIADSEADTVTIEILQVNQIPVAFAGSDQTINEGDPVQLDGSLSHDPDNDAITYLWTAPPEVTLSSNTIAQPEFTAPFVHYDSTLVFSLVVNDGQANSVADEVHIYVKNIDILSTEANILGITLANMSSVDIDEEQATAVMHMPYGYDVRDLAPVFNLSEWAKINPIGGTHRDFSIPQTYVVTAEDMTTTKTWTVSVHIPDVTLSRNISAGWNMLSLPVIPNNPAIDEVMSSLSFEELDYIKSPFASATWYSGYGWYGDLDEFPYFLSTKLYKNATGIWEVTGKEINPTLESVPVTWGWNSLPYLLNADADINEAIIPSSIPNGAVIKGEPGASVYYAESGWTGDITQLNLMHGYKLNVQSSGSIRYDADAVSSGQGIAALKSTKEVNSFYQQYSYSANIIGELADANRAAITQKGDCLMAYNNGVLCGKANAVYAGALNRYIFVLTYYGNHTDENITFRAQHQGKELSLDRAILFKADDVIGGAYHPEILIAPVTTGSISEELENTLTIAPNPADDVLYIYSTHPIKSKVIYNATGSIVLEEDNNQSAASINISQLPPGIYFIEVETEAQVYLHKFIKRSK